MLRRILLTSVFSLVLVILIPSCSVKYSFSGTNLETDIKTFTVYYFPNRAKLINPTLSQNFTEALRNKIERQTSLNEISERGDIEFEGQITGYEFKPMSVQKDDVAAQTRLTISMKVKYTDNKHTESSFEKNFSAFEDFDSSQAISSVEDDLTTEIIDKLVEDIFNATIANW